MRSWQRSFSAKGEYLDALRHAEKAQALNPFNDYSAALVGSPRAGLAIEKGPFGWARTAGGQVRRTVHPAISIALVYAGLGDHNARFKWLDKAYDERFNRLAYLRREPVWESL